MDMQLSDIFYALSSNELSNLNVVQDGVIASTAYPKVIAAINRGLQYLGSRFKLYKGQFTLVPNGDSIYYLTPSNAFSSGFSYAYLDDTQMPFKERLLEILAVTKEDLPIALDGSEGLLRVAVDTLAFKEVPTTPLVITYLALPKPVVFEYDEQDGYVDQEVALPIVYLNALIYFVASSFYMPTLSGLDGTRANTDLSYRQLCEAECRRLDAEGIDIDEAEPTNLFIQRGFI